MPTGKKPQRPKVGRKVETKGSRTLAAPARSAPSPGRRALGDARRRALVEAAFLTLAERGFEGLRTREIAARASVNIATLHYYFATKEALIAGVADSLLEQFQREGLSLKEKSPAARLRAELSSATLRLRKNPAVFTVLCELWLRALRDPAIGRVCRSLQEAWRGYLIGLIRDGVADGSLREELEPAATADLVMYVLHGVMAQQGVCKDLSSLEQACAQLERLLFRPSLAQQRSPAAAPRRAPRR
jgi:AcrR family transcriptional regulator